MSAGSEPRASFDFEPVLLRRRSRRTDPIVLGLLVVVGALTLAVAKPWGGDDVSVAEVPVTASPSVSPPPLPSGLAAPSAVLPAEVPPPTWSAIVPAISRRQVWGVRTIVLPPAVEVSRGAPPYAERWFSVAPSGTGGRSVVVDTGGAAIVALGVTTPRDETPLAVRVWLHHAGGTLEWIDAQPVNGHPAQGAYLFVRASGATAAPAPAATAFWEPGRYRVDVLVGDGIRRIEIEIVNRSGFVPSAEPWIRSSPSSFVEGGLPLGALPIGFFAVVDDDLIPLDSAPGVALDETGAWLDIDLEAPDGSARSFTARTYQPAASWLGVVLPPTSLVRSASLRQLAPHGGPSQYLGEASPGRVPVVGFRPAGGGTWPPGVYALTVDWLDGGREQQGTWHVELLPGPLREEPVLLTATRSWARHVGSDGILLGTPENWALYEGFDRSNAIGCGKTGIRGRPTVIGFVGPGDAVLTPVSSTVLFPFADAGPLPILSVSGSVPGLTIVAPVLTAAFGGPASYGFRAGTTDATFGYTVCIGLVAPAG